MIITSIDVGIIHLAIVKVSLSETSETDNNETSNLSIKHVIDAKLIDITKFDCLENCDLQHEKCIIDYINHVFARYHASLFGDDVDLILIEKQPPRGLVAVEQFLYARYREKCMFVHPKSVIAYFKLVNNYDLRKVQTIKMATKYLESFTSFNENSRKHDLADAMCFVLYYISVKNEEASLERQLQQIKNETKSLNKFEAFKLENCSGVFEKFRKVV